jgi:hypothetical protein
MFLGWSFIKFASMVSVHCTRWPPEVKIEKPLNDFSSETDDRIAMKLDRNVTWVVLNQNSPNSSGLLHNMGTRAKNRKKR